MPCSLPMHGGTGWVSHLNYEKERNLEIHHSDADSDSDGHRHHARRHLVHDVVVSPTTKENLPTLFYRGREVLFLTIQKLFGIMVAQGKDIHVNHSIADGIYQTVFIRDAPTP